MDKLFSPFRFFPLFGLLLIITLITSCSHIRKKDGPPHFYVDTSRIPNAVPKAEPRSKYGNLSSYRVFGKRYYTMHSSKNYEQVGIASWYGTKFHARRTSSGEPYNMLAMTAAHKTLPLPTYVEVTNLRNQRQIIVKVNDRGPFEGNRIIDLSYVAAKKLGMMGHGTAKVKIKAIDPNVYGKPTFDQSTFYLAENKNTTFYPQKVKTITTHQVTRTITKHSYPSVYLQVGSFRNKARAEKFRLHILHLVKAPVKVSHSPTNRHIYRVQVGPIKNTLAANKITSQLKRFGIKSNQYIGV